MAKNNVREPIEETTEPLQGQTAFPGFEEPAQDAEAIDKAARKISFQMDFMRDPEDALAAWGAPSDYFATYLKDRFDFIVQKAAEITGADPEQIRNPETRTPEQDSLLTEIAGRATVNRLDRFTNSLYFDALSWLYEEHPQDAEGNTVIGGFELDVIKEQAAIYFFALHSTIDPLTAGKLPQAQREELKEIFARLFAFYERRAAEIGEDAIKYGDTLSAFIRHENPEQSTAEAIIEKLPLLQSINPKSHTMPNNRLMNALQTDHLIEHPDDAQGWALTVANPKGRRKEITAFTMVTYDPGDTGITITNANLTEYERQVSDAIVSLWIEAKKEKLPAVFSPDMIYRAMPGGGEKASPQQRGAIIRTIEKFRRLHITVNATEEMRKRGLIKENEEYTIDSFFLNVTHAKYTVKHGGQTVHAYKVESEPIILTYSLMTNQLLTVPAKSIAIAGTSRNPRTKQLEVDPTRLIPMTPERQAMTGYLLRRIAVMKRDNEKAKEAYRNHRKRMKKDPTLSSKPVEAFREQSPVILFSTLFEDVGIEVTDRAKAHDSRNFCFSVLDYQTAIGEIRGYEKQTQGRSITGVKILL